MSARISYISFTYSNDVLFGTTSASLDSLHPVDYLSEYQTEQQNCESLIE
jgi:hypothetical protein